MKNRIYKKGRVLAMLAVAGIFTWNACKKIDDLVIIRDPLAIDAGIWDDESSVQYLLNDCYNFIIPNFPYDYLANSFGMHLVSDENYYSANDALGKAVFNFNGALTSDQCRYVATKYAGNNYGENRYFDIAKVNLGIKNLPGSPIEEDVKKPLLGQFYALRGMAYFGLTKIYGGMPLVLEPQSPGNIQLAGRQKASVMFKQIVQDFDSAIANLEGVTYNDATERGKITATAAAAMKAKALLWWASPLFNPVNDGKHTYDASRWQDAFKASEDAYNRAVADGRSLMKNYGEIFQTEGTGNTEAILVRSYSSSQLKKFNHMEEFSRPKSEGGNPNDVYNPSHQLLYAYLMKDGRPVTNSSDEYPFNDTIFWANRDPRFDATFAFNGSVWPLSGKNERRQWTYALATADGVEEAGKAFYVKRFSKSNIAKTSVGIANDAGGGGMDWIEIRFAEVILDYAETANEVGNLALAKEMVRKIRDRAGIEKDPFDYGLDLATNKEQMRDLILNERMVEFAFEGKRNEDLRRTRTMDKLEGTLTSMLPLQFKIDSKLGRDSIQKPFGPNDLGLAPDQSSRDTLNMYDPQAVTKWFVYPYTWSSPSGNGPFAMPSYYYFMSLSNQFLNSTPLLEQTIGWEGGTFDPL